MRRKRFPASIRLRAGARLLLIQNLALYLRSGISITESLNLLLTNARGDQRRLVLRTQERIHEGKSLSVALSSFPSTFPPLYLQIIRAGESSGFLSDSLTYLAQMLEGRSQLNRSILASLTYPIVLICGTAVLISILVLYAFPKIIPLLNGFNVELPWSTRTVLWVTHALHDHGLLYLLLSILTTVLSVYLYSYQNVRSLLQTNVLRLPVLQAVLQSYFLAVILRMLSVLLRSGMRLDVALEHVSTSISFAPYKVALIEVEEAVMQGNTCSAGMKINPHAFPELCTHIVAAGEKTGTLSSSMEMLAEMYSNEVERRIKTLTTLIEPALLIVIGVIVGTIALAIISPMYGVTQHISA